MAKQDTKLGEFLRRRIRQAEREGVTRYQISKATDIPESNLSRFYNGKGGLRSIENIDRLMQFFNLEVVERVPTSRKGR